jgi:RNA polymerase sigma-70 factor (ECF subfamily)
MGGGVFLNEQDEILLKKAKSGDVDAYEELVKTYYKTVFNIALRMFSNTEDASDITQEVFIKVYKSIGRFEGRSSFKTWIYRIATNLCLDELRSRKNFIAVSFDEQIANNTEAINVKLKDESIGSPETELLRAEIREELYNVINELPEDLRIITILRHIQNLSYDEISEILNCPQGTIKSRISRARELLRKKLSKNMELFDSRFVKEDRKE